MTRRRASLWSLIITVLLFLAVSFMYQHTDFRQMLPAPIRVQPGYHRVTEVHDGDTISVGMGGTIEKVRMIGVDTPETHKPNAPVQCFGPQASDYAKQLLQGKTVRLEADPTNDNRDRYDRLLRYVYLEDGTLVEKKLIELGYGFAYLSFPFQKSGQFAALQETARASGVGLWSACQTTLKSGRWQTNNL